MRLATIIVMAVAINVAGLAEAIRQAEGVDSKYPYGILQKYEHTTPKQACINTIRHGLRDWDGTGDFITFLGSRYCPPSAHPLNKNWVGNVKYFYNKGGSNGMFRIAWTEQHEVVWQGRTAEKALEELEASMECPSRKSTEVTECVVDREDGADAMGLAKEDKIDTKNWEV